MKYREEEEEEKKHEKTYFTLLLADIISDIRFLGDKQQTRKQNNTNLT